MTLEEAIKHCEEVAEKEQCKGFDANTKSNCKTVQGKRHYKCAEEHRQLAEWLKELQAKRKQVEILARCLDGCPLTIPCDKMFVLGGWCERHCKERDLTCPDSECWLRYAEVIANERLD